MALTYLFGLPSASTPTPTPAPTPTPTASSSGGLIFKATFTGYQTVPNGSFQKVKLNNIVRDPLSAWSSVDNTWTVPTTGTYKLTSKIRIEDGVPAGISWGFASNKTSVTDNADFIWLNTQNNRQGTAPNVSVIDFTAGDVVHLYMYFDGSTGVNLNGASLTIEQLNVVSAPVVSALTITGTPADATAGSPYSFTPTVGGGSGTKAFSISSNLPSGLSISTTTGTISGTPATSSNFEGAITVTDTSGSKSLSITIKIVPGATLTISGTPPAGKVGVAYSYTPTVTGATGAKTFAAYGYTPPWVVFNTSTGSVSGTPDVNETVDFEIEVTDTKGSATQTVTFEVGY